MSTTIAGRARTVFVTGQYYVFEGAGSNAAVTVQASAAAADSRVSTVDVGKGFTYPPRGDRKT
jgi:hypothetical protein